MFKFIQAYSISIYLFIYECNSLYLQIIIINPKPLLSSPGLRSVTFCSAWCLSLFCFFVVVFCFVLNCCTIVYSVCLYCAVKKRDILLTDKLTVTGNSTISCPLNVSVFCLSAGKLKLDGSWRFVSFFICFCLLVCFCLFCCLTFNSFLLFRKQLRRSSVRKPQKKTKVCTHTDGLKHTQTCLFFYPCGDFALTSIHIPDVFTAQPCPLILTWPHTPHKISIPTHGEQALVPTGCFSGKWSPQCCKNMSMHTHSEPILPNIVCVFVY